MNAFLKAGALCRAHSDVTPCPPVWRSATQGMALRYVQYCVPPEGRRHTPFRMWHSAMSIVEFGHAQCAVPPLDGHSATRQRRYAVQIVAFRHQGMALRHAQCGVPPPGHGVTPCLVWRSATRAWRYAVQNVALRYIGSGIKLDRLALRLRLLGRRERYAVSTCIFCKQ